MKISNGHKFDNNLVVIHVLHLTKVFFYDIEIWCVYIVYPCTIISSCVIPLLIFLCWVNNIKECSQYISDWYNCTVVLNLHSFCGICSLCTHLIICWVAHIWVCVTNNCWYNTGSFSKYFLRSPKATGGHVNYAGVH